VGQHNDPVTAASQLGRDRAAHESGASGDRHSAAGRRAGLGERLADRPGSKQEDPSQLVTNDERVHRVAGRPDRQLVVHLVEHERPTGSVLKGVPVLPVPVRPVNLQIDEPVRRVVLGDPRQPPDRDAEQGTDAVANLEPRFHRRLIGQIFEGERARGDPMKVARLREECEDLVARPGDEEFRTDVMPSHVT